MSNIDKNITSLTVSGYYDSKGLEIDWEGEDSDGTMGLVSMEQMELTESLIAIMIGEELARASNEAVVDGSVCDTLMQMKIGLRDELLNKFQHKFSI